MPSNTYQDNRGVSLNYDCVAQAANPNSESRQVPCLSVLLSVINIPTPIYRGLCFITSPVITTWNSNHISTYSFSSFNMTPSMMEVFVFGDQSTRFAPPLKDLLLKGNSPYLTHFVKQVHALLRREISSLPAVQQKLFPNFADIQELVSKSDWGSGNPALTSALACFYHLCSFIQ